MSKLTGIFAAYEDLDLIPIVRYEYWLKSKVERHTIQNFIGNRIIYPHSVPVTSQDMEIDFAILREIISFNNIKFYDPQKKSLVIPEEFFQRFLPREKLITIFVESLAPKEITQIYKSSNRKFRVVGTIIAPTSQIDKDVEVVDQKGKRSTLKRGAITILPFSEAVINLEFNNKNYEVAGGECGVVIDLREAGV